MFWSQFTQLVLVRDPFILTAVDAAHSDGNRLRFVQIRPQIKSSNLNYNMFRCLACIFNVPVYCFASLICPETIMFEMSNNSAFSHRSESIWWMEFRRSLNRQKPFVYLIFMDLVSVHFPAKRFGCRDGQNGNISQLEIDCRGISNSLIFIISLSLPVELRLFCAVRHLVSTFNFYEIQSQIVNALPLNA